MADKAYFISDLHLGSATEPNAFVLIKFLRSFTSKDQITHLFLVGDIFDMWISNHLYFKRKFSAVISELVRLKGMGVEVHYFEGNHDLYLQSYFGQELGFKVHECAAYFKLNDLVVRVEHGDQMDLTDVWYLRLRAFWRSAPLKWLAPRLPGEWLGKFGEAASEKSRKKSASHQGASAQLDVKTEIRLKRVIVDHVRRVWEKKPFDLFIAGHLHLHDDTDVQIITGSVRRETRAVNLGSWYSPPQVFTVQPDAIEFRALE